MLTPFGGQPVGMIERWYRRVVGLVVGLDGPIHPRSKVVLISLTLAPNRGFVSRMPVAVHAHHFIHRVGPERSGFKLRKPFLHAGRIELIASPQLILNVIPARGTHL